MKSCYIVAAAELAPERLRPEPGDMLIAADAGLLHLERLGLAPDLALGDFDSLGYVPEAPQVEVCPVRKDDTDTMAALRRALELGYRRALIFGGLGGRVFAPARANARAKRRFRAILDARSVAPLSRSASAAQRGAFR